MKAETYFEDHGIVTQDIDIMTQGSIVYSKDKSNFDPARVKRYLDKRFPEVDSKGMLVLDWETGPFQDLKKNSANDEKFKAAEDKLLALLRQVRLLRPNLKLTYYSIPYRTWNDWQRYNYNPDGKYNNLLAKVDFIAPSLYILYSDEEVGHERNLEYLKDNLDVALAYGKRFNIPVTPFVWHRIHGGSKLYPHGIMQKEVFAQYVKFVSTYSYNNYRASGVYWWDDATNRLRNLEGVGNHLQGKVRDADTYDAMLVEYAKEVVQELNK